MKDLATFDARITLHPLPDTDPDAEPPPTVGAGNTEDVVGSFIPTTDLLASVLKQVVEQATQLSVGVSVERVDK